MSEAHSMSGMTRIRNYFLTGVIVCAPIAITTYIAWTLVHGVDSWVKPYIPGRYNPDNYLPFTVPGFGLIVALIVITLVGFLTANIIGRSIVSLGERLLNRMPLRWLPRWMGALLLVVGMLAGVGALGMFVAGPAGDWARRVPFVLRDAAPKLREMVAPIQEATKAGETLDTITGEDDDDVERVVVRPPRADLLSATPKVLGSTLAVILLTFAFLVFGDDVLNKLLTLRPTRAHRKLTGDIVQEIQSDLSRYMLTISATSTVLGAATAAWLYYLDVDDPLLWGVLAAVLNLTPFLGPLITAALLLLVGLSEFDSLGMASLPAAGFLFLHALESQLLTPLVLGRTMHINPLAIILWLLVWGWLWGIIGLLVAVPMLVCLKIVASRVRGWEHWARMLE